MWGQDWERLSTVLTSLLQLSEYQYDIHAVPMIYWNNNFISICNRSEDRFVRYLVPLAASAGLPVNDVDSTSVTIQWTFWRVTLFACKHKIMNQSKTVFSPFVRYIVGLEMNSELCQLQSQVCQKFAMTDRVQIECSEMTTRWVQFLSASISKVFMK